MKTAITTIKNNVETFIKKIGFIKTTVDDCSVNANRVYYRYGRFLFVLVDGFAFCFGYDKIDGSFAHICYNGCDCGTYWANDVEKTLYNYINGSRTAKEIEKEYFEETI